MSAELIDPANIARDARLIHRAVRGGWNIPDEIATTLPKTMADIATGAGQKPTDRIAAARVLVAMKDRNDKIGRSRKPKLFQSVQQTILVIDGNLDEAKRVIAERIARLVGICNERLHDGGTTTEATTVAGRSV